MAECNTLDDLVDEETKALGVDSHSIVLQHFQQILLDVLKHQVEPSLALERLFKHDDVFVLQKSKHLDFPHDGFLGNFIVLRLFEFLNCNCRPLN